MKKTFTLLMTLALALSALTACGGRGEKVYTSTPYEIYTLANERLEALTTMSASATIDYLITIDGEEMPVYMQMDIKLSGVALQIESSTMANFEGESMLMPINMTLLDGMFYYHVGIGMAKGAEDDGIKIKIPFEADEFDELMESAVQTTGSYDFDLIESNFKDATVTERNEGYTVFVSVSGEELARLCDELLRDTLTNVNPQSFVEWITIGSFDYILNVDKSGNLESSEVIIDITIEMDGREILTNMHIFMEYSELPADYVIEAPEDADTYTNGADMGITAQALLQIMAN